MERERENGTCANGIRIWQPRNKNQWNKNDTVNYICCDKIHLTYSLLFISFVYFYLNFNHFDCMRTTHQCICTDTFTVTNGRRRQMNKKKVLQHDRNNGMASNKGEKKKNYLRKIHTQLKLITQTKQ